MAEIDEIAMRWESLGRLAHYHPGELARLVHQTQRGLHREFWRLFGRSPREWLAQVRFRDAAARLHSGELAKCAGAEVGFRHPESFCRWLKSRAEGGASALKPSGASSMVWLTLGESPSPRCSA